MSEGESTGIGEKENNFRIRAELPNRPESERDRALKTLVDVGLLTPLTQLDTFHGRVGKKDEKWEVVPTFANHGNATGNANVNERSTLYTGDAKTAQDFAVARGIRPFLQTHRQEIEERIKNYSPAERQRWLERINKQAEMSPLPRKYGLEDVTEGRFGYRSLMLEETESIARKILTGEIYATLKEPRADVRPEVHEVISRDPHALAIDIQFKPNSLSEEDRIKYEQALRKIVIPVTEGAPVDFKARGAITKFAVAVAQLQEDYISREKIKDIAQATGNSEEVTLQLASAYNSRQVALSNPASLANLLLQHPSDIFTATMTSNGEKVNVPLNLEYVERYMNLAHIVAVKQSVSSATLARELTSISFFDLDKIGTRDQIEKQRREMLERMGGLLDTFPPLPSTENSGKAQALLRNLEDPYIDPEKLIASVKHIHEFSNIYNNDAGNWEGYTLGEHTETVLRNFDENFADIIPTEYLAPMRLAILAHDMGKPLAVARGEKYKQKEYNAFYAKNFFNTIGIDPRLRDMLTAIITDGSDLAFALQKQPQNTSAQVAMNMYAEDILKRYLSKAEVNDSEKQAFIEMCKMFQLCDGGAYTSMAITRQEGVGRFRNAPSFNRSFQEPTGLGKRDIRYKKS